MAKYINVDMAKQALEKGLNVWAYSMRFADVWGLSSITAMINPINSDYRFAIGEKPTSPPRKMIEIDGVPMPAPITQEDAEVLQSFAILEASGATSVSRNASLWPFIFAMGNAFATEADAIAARDARKLILERAK